MAVNYYLNETGFMCSGEERAFRSSVLNSNAMQPIETHSLIFASGPSFSLISTTSFQTGIQT